MWYLAWSLTTFWDSQSHANAFLSFFFFYLKQRTWKFYCVLFSSLLATFTIFSSLRCSVVSLWCVRVRFSSSSIWDFVRLLESVNLLLIGFVKLSVIIFRFFLYLVFFSFWVSVTCIILGLLYLSYIFHLLISTCLILYNLSSSPLMFSSVESDLLKPSSDFVILVIVEIQFGFFLNLLDLFLIVSCSLQICSGLSFIF